MWVGPERRARPLPHIAPAEPTPRCGVRSDFPLDLKRQTPPSPATPCIGFKPGHVHGWLAALHTHGLTETSLRDRHRLGALLEQVEGVAAPDATRLVKLLTGAGILFKRGIQYRLSPDLLADAIIEDSCINLGGHSNGYAERVFDAAASAYLDHLFVNLGRLDWRRGNGDTTNSALLAGLW